MRHALIATCVCLSLFTFTAAGQTPKPPASPSSSEVWMTYYYQDPSPDRLVTEYRKMAQDRVFTKHNAVPPTFAFFSQIMAQNPTRIPEWIAALHDLPEEDKHVLHLALWYSKTPQANAYFQKKQMADFLNYNPPDILTLPLNDGGVIDALWGYFLATGDPEPVRRIVSVLNLAPYHEALENYAVSDKTEEDQRNAKRGAIFLAARWSLSSNCKQHKRVFEICHEILRSEDITETEKLWLALVLTMSQQNHIP